MKRFLLLLAFCCFAVLPACAADYQFLDDQAEAQTSIAFTAKTATAGNLSLVFDWRDANNFYALDMAPGAATLKSTIAGTARTLDTARVDWKPSSSVTLKRRPWLMEVIVDHKVVLTAYDATFNTGKIGSRGGGGWSLSDARVQPVEELYFADDFTRTGDQESEWKAADGKWTITSSSDNISDRNVAMSTNPFSYAVATPTGKAFSHVGRWFWDNYHAQVSAKPAARGAIGLAVYVQDKDNYLAFIWSATEGPEARRLVRVVDGTPTVIAKAPGAFLPRQWYRLGVRTSPGFVEAFVDGAQVLKANNTWFGQGGIGLIGQNESGVNFDDVRVQSYDFYRQDFSGPLSGAWTPVGGTWKTNNDLLNATDATDTARFLVAGRNEWSGYEMHALARPGDKGAAGLVAGYRDDKNYALFRWAGADSAVPFKGRQQLVRYKDGKATIVSDEPLKLSAGADGLVPITLRAMSGALTVASGDGVIAQMADESFPSGRAGLWAQGSGTASFKDVVIFFPPPPIPPRVAPKMAEDALMVGWASKSGEWPPFFTENGTEFWNTGDFFGDAAVEYRWRPDLPHSKIELSLRAKRGDFDSGTVVGFDPLPDGSGLNCTLSQNGKVLKQAQFPWKQVDEAILKNTDDETGGVPLRVSLEGRALMLTIGGKPALSALDVSGKAPAGTCFAARSRGAMSARTLSATSANRDDYTFTEAPIDWYAPQGNWSVFSRWPCYSDWSFFGGKGVNPVLWSKRTYGGDTVVEIYAHNQMDMPKEIGYSNPGNLNITIGGDGKNVASGYSFVVAGWHDTRTRLMKGTTVVADNTTEDARFIKPINHNFSFHKRWYYIRAEVRQGVKNGKKGATISLSVDDMPLCEYFDTAPLPAIERGGRVAIWTVDGSIMVARAKIESERFGARKMPDGLVDSVDVTAPAAQGDEWMPRPVASDGVPSALVQPDKGDGGWTVQDPTTGGLFAVNLVKASDKDGAAWKANANTRLDMDMNLPAGVKIDAYVSINGVSHLISLTDDQKPDARVRPLGEARTSSAGGWQHVSFALGAALAKMYPGTTTWNVDAITLGALHGDEYRWLGFDGNALGATYHVRGIKVMTG